MLLQPMHKTYTDKIRVISLNMPCLRSSSSCSRTSYIMYTYNLWCRFLWSCPQSYGTPQFPLVTYLFVYLWYHLSLLRFIENQKFGLCHERHHLKDSKQIKTLSLLKNFTFERSVLTLTCGGELCMIKWGCTDFMPPWPNHWITEFWDIILILT